MKKFFAVALFIAGLALFASVAAAQTPTLTFTAQTTTGAGSVIPVLTWSTAPVATSCTASGDPAWTGTKAASGTATLAAITTSKTYALVCAWPGKTSTVLTWIPPTTNTDGTPYTNAKGFRIQFGIPPANLTQTKSINVPNATTDTITGLTTAGTWGFCIRAVNTLDVESDCTATVTSVISPTTSLTRSVAITVNPKPNPPTAPTAE